MVTTGNITGLTNELENDGLVERMVDPTSRRAFLVRLTPKGRRQFKTAAKALAEIVHRPKLSHWVNTQRQF